MAQHPLKDGFNPGIVSTLGPWDPGNTGPGLESGVINLNNNLRPHPPGVGRIEEKVATNNISNMDDPFFFIWVLDKHIY